MSVINFELSPWLIPLCLLLAGGLTYLLYSKTNPWGRTVNVVLMSLRFILFSLLALLLLNPLFKQFTKEVESPMAVIAVDNSESMLNGQSLESVNALLTHVDELKEKLKAQNYEVEVQTMNGRVDDLSGLTFDQKTSNLNAWLNNLQSEKEGVNLARVYLISDGIYNQGVSPAYFPFGFPLSTIGVGDTLQKSDLVLKNVYYNKIAYQGNKFPVMAEVVNYGFKGEKSQVQIASGGKVLSSKTVDFGQAQGLQAVHFEVEAKKVGYQRLSVQVNPLSNEATTDNNRRNVYIDIVDGKQKILLIAPAPHPDLKALAAVMQKNANYELTTFIPGITEYEKEKYDLVIWHEAYDRWNRCKKYVDELKETGVPVFYVIGRVSNTNLANQSESHLDIVRKGNQRDNVVGALNLDFKKFTIAELTNKNLSSFPPLSVQYGDFNLSANADVLLYQKVGSVTTDKPLLYLVEENDKKSGYMVADDFWKWRMQEFALHDNSETFDELFMKVIQYLSTKVDKRKFRFATTQNEYFTNEVVQFEAELYNEIYERIYNEEIQVNIFNDEGFSQEATFSPASSFSKLDFSGFEEGTYHYKADVTLNNKTETVRGVFVVKELQLEQIDQVADFAMLRQLAQNSEGQFYAATDFRKVLSDVDMLDDKSVIHTEEEILPLIYIKWILFVLFLIVAIEWLGRKYFGGY